MILGDQDIPVVHLCWDGTEAEPTLLDLEHWRDAIERRLRKIAANPDPLVLEGFEYTHLGSALEARGALTDKLLTALEELDERIEVQRHA